MSTDLTNVETQELPPRRDPPRRGVSARMVSPGQLVAGRFQLEEEIGRGSQGIVYRALDRSLDRAVAIKVLRGDAPGAARERFLREAQTVSRLRHPGIVLVYEAGAVGERGLYYAMELVGGRSLEEVFEAEGALDPARAVRIMEAVALAVHHAHDAGLVHRDLKPGNVLLDGQEQPRIADFGLVTLAEGTRLTATRSVVGTPVYMAPEQAQGERVDRRADVYSLGAILYEALGGRPPFTGETPLAIFKKVVEEDPPPLRGLARDVPEKLERVCLGALEKDPRSRYPTAAAFARDLRRALEGLAPISPGSPLPRGIRRRIRRAWPLGRQLLVLGLGVALGVPAGALLRGTEPLPDGRAAGPARSPAPPPDPVRAAQREQLLGLARAERGRGLPAATIDWLRALGPEELRHDPGARGDLARARALEAIAWHDLRRPDEARRSLGLGLLWASEAGREVALLLVARSLLLARGGDPEAGLRELERARRIDPDLPELHQALSRLGPPAGRIAAIDRAIELTEPEPWPALLRDRVRVSMARGEIERARADSIRLAAGPATPPGAFAFELALGKSDVAAVRSSLMALSADPDPECRALAAKALGLLR